MLQRAQTPKKFPRFGGAYLSDTEVVECFDAVLACLKDSLYYKAVHNERSRVRSIMEAQDLLRTIAASIEPDPSVPASENLPRLLQFIVFSLDTTLRTAKMAPVQEAASMLQPIRDTFMELAFA
jgi:flagellin-specific chaperone FliS